MSDLSDDARALLARDRRDREVDHVALARVRRRLMTAAVTTAAAGATGTALSGKAVAAPAGAWWTLAYKAFGGLVLVGSVTVGSMVLERHLEAGSSKQTSVATQRSVPSAARASAPPIGSAAVPEQAPERAATPVVAVSSLPVAPAERSETVERAGSPARTSIRTETPAPGEPATATIPASPAEDPWIADAELLRAAQAAIVAGDARRARSLALRVDRDGPFADEREVLVLVADCRIASERHGGSDSAATTDREASGAAAHARAATFVRSHRGTAHASRVRDACAER